jgi:hypothetical protein
VEVVARGQPRIASLSFHPSCEQLGLPALVEVVARGLGIAHLIAKAGLTHRTNASVSNDAAQDNRGWDDDHLVSGI